MAKLSAAKLVEILNDMTAADMASTGEVMEDSQRMRLTGDVTTYRGRTWYGVRDGISGFSYSGWVSQGTAGVDFAEMVGDDW